MKETDSLLIGHNEMNFAQYERSVRSMGINSGAYRDLGKSVLYFNNTALPITDVINYCEARVKPDFKPFNMLETFSNAIGYLGTYLHRRGFTFDFVNSFQDEKPALAEKLKKGNIRTVGIITTLYVSALPILEIIKFVRQYNSTAKIVIGGPFVATQVRTQEPATVDYLFKMIGADYYINSSQGEATFVKLLQALKTGAAVNDIKNLWYKTPQGYVANPVETEDNKLHENTVDWSLFNTSVDEHVAIRTAISCPYKCAFCGFPEHAGQYQVSEIDPIVQELDLLTQIKTLRSVHFVDDTFNIPKNRFKSLLKAIIKKGYNFKWHSYYRCQFADDETMMLMKESGCEGVFLGIESGSNTILKNMDKAVKIGEYYHGMEYLKKYEIPTFGCFIIGFPGETRATVQETVDFIEKTELDFYRTQQWYLEPITPIWRQKEKYGIKGSSFEWSHATMDSREACDIVDELFLSITKSVWLPQYNFDFDNVLHFLHKGKTIKDMKDFLTVFNKGVQERLRHPERQEASPELIGELIRIWAGGTATAQQPDTGMSTADMFNF